MNKVHEFIVPKETLRRCFSLYVVIADKNNNAKIYVGKTGDNRIGCNPIISRCGNHFSYNSIQSQVRNKLPKHEEYNYKYFFAHFLPYKEGNRFGVDLINEMERNAINAINVIYENEPNIEVLNQRILGKHITKPEQLKRKSFRTKENMDLMTNLLKASQKYADKFRKRS